MLANIATFMIMDDHDITDDWNLTGGWVEQMIETDGWTDVIVDGLVAYWVYQGWGNLDPASNDDDPRVQIMRKYAGSGADALKPLRKLMYDKFNVEPRDRLRWDYSVPSSPPIFVLDTRNDRVLKPPERDASGKVIRYASDEDRIISKRQLDELLADLKKNDEPAILVSPVTVLNPLLIHVFLSLAARPSEVTAAEAKKNLSLSQSFGGLEVLNAETYENYRRLYDLEYWPAFPQSFTDLREMLDKLRDSSNHERSLIILSGDVHYSYAMSLRTATRNWIWRRQTPKVATSNSSSRPSSG